MVWFENSLLIQRYSKKLTFYLFVSLFWFESYPMTNNHWKHLRVRIRHTFYVTLQFITLILQNIHNSLTLIGSQLQIKKLIKQKRLIGIFLWKSTLSGIGLHIELHRMISCKKYPLGMQKNSYFLTSPLFREWILKKLELFDFP